MSWKSNGKRQKSQKRKKENKKAMLTESNKMFEALKSRYMTGFSAS